MTCPSRASLLFLCLTGCLAGCGGDSMGPLDAGSDAGEPDAQLDAAEPDASADAGSDAGVDAGLMDAGLVDAGSDATPDAAMCAPTCVPPANATADCSAGTCDFVCDTGWVRRGDGCIEELGCVPGVVGSAVLVTDDDHNHGHLSPTVAISGSVLAVTWVRSSPSDLLVRFYDYPALTPRTGALVVNSTSGETTTRVEVVPVSDGFAISYERVNISSGNTRCAFNRYDTDGVRLRSNTDAGEFCGFAGSDAGFASAWAVGRRINTRRFNLDGTTVGGTPTALITDSGESGTSNHITWHPGRTDYRLAYVISAGGGALDLVTATLSLTGFRTSRDVPAVSGFARMRNPDIVAAGPGYALLFSDGPGMRYLVGLDAEGAPTASPMLIGTFTEAALAAGPHELAVGVAIAAERDVAVQIFDHEANPLGSSVVLASGPSRAEGPDVAWVGDGFVAAWSDDVAAAGLQDVYIARVCPAR